MGQLQLKKPQESKCNGRKITDIILAGKMEKKLESNENLQYSQAILSLALVIG